MKLDVDAFHSEMEKQKNRSRRATKLETSDWVELIKDDTEEFIGYDCLETDVRITKYREVKTKDGIQFQLVFNLTPFYPEGGGQLGDVGTIVSKSETIEIVDTKKENNLIIHISEVLPINVNDVFSARVNKDIRKSSERNHTATHLLHESLREVLGPHVEQKGSLVCSDYLRFDFTHFSKLSQKS